MPGKEHDGLEELTQLSRAGSVERTIEPLPKGDRRVDV
jgi:hypothetical protein